MRICVCECAHARAHTCAFAATSRAGSRAPARSGKTLENTTAWTAQLQSSYIRSITLAGWYGVPACNHELARGAKTSRRARMSVCMHMQPPQPSPARECSGIRQCLCLPAVWYAPQLLRAAVRAKLLSKLLPNLPFYMARCAPMPMPTPMLMPCRAGCGGGIYLQSNEGFLGGHTSRPAKLCSSRLMYMTLLR